MFELKALKKADAKSHRRLSLVDWASGNVL